ncbi:hypothetical protein DSO57_1010212 [Entomophthora muscae]|uniref:Uncharacterized protein n=1 Tax=Entomophthora muscae TaxID=34485 RepID=A0ACC2RLD6_9FUNG|nr:hypothetical protein DSO57_1010212 [Entomophthora muscae]
MMTKNLIASVWKNTNVTPDDPKNSDPTTKPAKGSSSQVQNVIVNQSLTKVEMPQMVELTLKEARHAMPVLQLHFQAVMNNGIHHVLISPLLGHFKDKSLAFAFDSQNELASASGSMIVWFPDSAQLTCPTHACGK